MMTLYRGNQPKEGKCQKIGGWSSGIGVFSTNAHATQQTSNSVAQSNSDQVLKKEAICNSWPLKSLVQIIWYLGNQISRKKWRAILVCWWMFKQTNKNTTKKNKINKNPTFFTSSCLPHLVNWMTFCRACIIQTLSFCFCLLFFYSHSFVCIEYGKGLYAKKMLHTHVIARWYPDKQARRELL